MFQILIYWTSSFLRKVKSALLTASIGAEITMVAMAATRTVRKCIVEVEWAFWRQDVDKAF